MKPLLLIITDKAPSGYWPEWHAVWCAPAQTEVSEFSVDEVIFMPGQGVAPLCQGLFAGACWPREVPMALITDEALLLPDPGSNIPLANLSEKDSGMLFFPQHKYFIQCAEEALRAHNPALGMVTLLDGWHQASICFDSSKE